MSLTEALYIVVPMYDAVSLLAFLMVKSGVTVAVATPFTTFTLSGLDEPVSLPLSFIVIPFSLNIRFPSFTLLLLLSFTVALSVSFSPITPVTVDVVVFVFILSLTVIFISPSFFSYWLFPS